MLGIFGILALLAILVLTSILPAPDERIALVTPTAAVTTGTPSLSASPLPPGTFENLILGYRITLPTGYRRSRTTIVTGQDEALGGDSYTLQTESEAREQCLHDTGDVGVGAGSLDRAPDITVGVSRNVRGISAMEWATTPRVPGAQPLSTHRKVEAVTFKGYEAIRLVWEQTGETAVFVIRANDRLYVVNPDGDSLPSRMPKGWFDDIANSLTVIQPAPFPTPTATTPPRDAARQVGDALARAFAARDVDAVVRLMPSCWVFVAPLINGQQPGGILYRSVALFNRGLRDRFGAGDLTVAVDPTVQVVVQGGRERFFVRSDWREPDRTTRIDLYLEEFDGQWGWSTAQPYFQRAQLINGCIPYRSPWISGSGAC